MNLSTVFWITTLMGPLVLLSYVRGVQAVDDPTVYWGSVPESMRSRIVPWMFVAALGYLLMWHRFYFAWDQADVASLHWPWQVADGRGVERLLTVSCVFLIASMVWIDATRLYIESPSALRQAMVIIVLWAAGLASIGFAVLTWSQRGVLPGANVAIVGSVMLAIQCLWWDAIYWVARFGWNTA